MQSYTTPGTPGKIMIWEKDEAQLISKEGKKLYRSGVGMLLYLVKHSRPDIANPVRELSKVLDGAKHETFKGTFCVVKYVLDTKHMGMRMEPIEGDETW